MRPGLRTPGQTNTDISVQKSLPVGGTTVSLRADILNVFDNPLFSGPVGTYGTGNFGQITAVNGFARSLQFQASYTDISFDREIANAQVGYNAADLSAGLVSRIP